MSWGLGPPQLWEHEDDRLRRTPLLIRLYRMGDRGLPVGPGTRYMGGLRTNDALRLELKGIASLVRDDKGRIVRAYSKQLLFDF